ncbi:c-type cytochrome [Alsobacter sp. KACC 23698]|uniref:C-type cytochrome n=1 Tax=Alsobacter sp. KACC 23698 TaxID=3149229 RepID=A0AAU7JLF0_9HYPH
MISAAKPSSRRTILVLSFWAFVAVASGTGGVLAYVYSGIYDISASGQHTPLVSWLVSTARRQSIQRHAAGIAPPPGYDDRASVALGQALFERDCVTCHGAPGVAPGAVGLGLNPPPPPAGRMSRAQTAPEIYWAITNGIKMTGMPAWEYRLGESERWALTAFLKSSAALSPTEYRRLADGPPRDLGAARPPNVAWTPDGAVERGRTALRQYACATCHVIPGIRSAESQVGPPLDGVGERLYLAGVLWNTPDNLAAWVRNPQRIKPETAMPDLGVSESDARDMVAYLQTLR